MEDVITIRLQMPMSEYVALSAINSKPIVAALRCDVDPTCDMRADCESDDPGPVQFRVSGRPQPVEIFPASFAEHFGLLDTETRSAPVRWRG
jgi:hypothetical protein